MDSNDIYIRRYIFGVWSWFLQTHPPVSLPTACTLTPIVVDSLSLVMSHVGRRASNATYRLQVTIDRRQSEKQLQREDAELRVTPAAALRCQRHPELFSS